METFVHADRTQGGKLLLGFTHHGKSHLVIGAFYHHPVMQNEAVSVFHNTHPQSQLHRNTCLPLADPFGMRLEQGKYFL